MVSGLRIVPLMETNTGLLLMLLILCFIIIGDFLPNINAELINCLESDREALIDFKNGLHDPDNRLSSWKGRNCCQWRGISCDNSTGAVIAVDLHNPYPARLDSSSRYGFWNLSGEIRPSLTKLKSLRHLDLSLNTFNDNPIPGFFGLLKNLQYLNLSNARFSGEIPPSLGNLSSLQYFDLKDSQNLYVKSFEWVPGLVSLKHLVMQGVDLSLLGSDWIKTLNKLPSLTELDLSFCGLHAGSIPHFTFFNLTSLAVLELSNNLFNSKVPDWLFNMSSLEIIDMSSSDLHGSIPLGFSELPNLKVLYLAGNNNLTANCYELLRGKWEKIQVLYFASNSLHGKLPASIGNMTFLTSLNLAKNYVEGEIPSSRRPLPSLQSLDLSNNHLVGKLPEWLGELENLVELDLSFNTLYGPIPASLGLLQNLIDLRLQGNELNGTLPESLGKLSELISFDVSSNQLTGTVTEAHFLMQKKLKRLGLSSNSFTINVSSNWVPPFQVNYLDLGSCNLGPSFPAWLESQKEVDYLDFSNASISGSIPHWFWENSSNIMELNVSYNQIEGHLPSPLNLGTTVDFSSNLLNGSIPIPSGSIYFLDLSKNKFSGTIPNNMSGLYFLSISDNQINGEIPASIGNNPSFLVIDLSGNNLTGSIPTSLGNCTILTVLDLSRNNLSGNIPSSLGRKGSLQTLHLSDNRFSGELPSSFQYLPSLETLDVGNNRLMGRIPPWINGEGFGSLKVLSLRGNAFSGEIPSGLSSLSSIQVLDLADNQLNGSIPSSFGDFKAMSQVQNISRLLFYGMSNNFYYKESIVINMKGQSQRFSRTLSLVVSLDLSGNNLSGDLPGEITKLLGLVFLNLSRNHISGHIPESISKLKQLSSLDLSSNKLSGPIPQSLVSLSFLGYLNLSNNEFSRRIPYKGHMTTFDAPSFSRNPGLCGSPLAVKCPGDEDDDKPDKGWTTLKNDGNNGDNFIDTWFYLSIGLRFAAGILVPYLIMAMRKSLSVGYFEAVDKVTDKILYLWLKYQTIKQRTRGHQQRR